MDHTVTLNLAGNLPDKVGKHTFTWTWKIYAIPVGNPNYCAAEKIISTTHTYYTLLSTPQAPMGQPWSSVLEKACTWVNEKTTPENATTKITEKLYNCGYDYATATGGSKYSVFGDPSQINLKLLIAELNNPTGIYVNCVDLSRAIVIFSNALGVSLSAKRFNSSFGMGNFFPVNCINLIGSIASMTNDPFYTYKISDDCRLGGFQFHAFAEDTNSNVWDATLMYDIDSDPDNVTNVNNSGCGLKSSDTDFNWHLPCNEGETSYIKHLVDNYVKQNNNININCSVPSNCGYFSNDNFTINPY
jgi:hypothetical protein